MKKIYVTRQRKYLDNGRNDSRYTLTDFIENQVSEFMSTNFPQYTQADYKGIYSLGIQEVYNDTEGFAVIERDDLTHSEAQMLLGMTDVIEFMGITKISSNNAKNWLVDNGYPKISNGVYEIVPEDVFEGNITPAVHLSL